MSDLTRQTNEGFEWMRHKGGSIQTAERVCPYLNTSPSSMAWHLGRFLAVYPEWSEGAPTEGRTEVTMGRAYTLNVRHRGGCVRRFKWLEDNTFKEVRDDHAQIRARQA